MRHVSQSSRITNIFGGSKEDLLDVRRSVKVPILRKDFTVDLRDICDAKIMGADCVLLIVAALEKKLTLRISLHFVKI